MMRMAEACRLFLVVVLWTTSNQKATATSCDPEDDSSDICDDGNPLTMDVCDESTENCAHLCDSTNSCDIVAWDEYNQCVVIGEVKCADSDPNTIDFCDPASGCVHSCVPQETCTVASLDPVSGNCTIEEKVCNDNNPDTVDSCEVLSGECVFQCVVPDGDRCLVSEPASDGGSCETSLINCDDDDSDTLDFCDPKIGCIHAEMSEDFDADEYFAAYGDEDELYFYTDEPTITKEQEQDILAWLQYETIQESLGFCWRRSYGRGVGNVGTKCPEGKERIGSLCYTPCESGYSRQGTFDCQQECLSGWRDDGIFCRKAEYGRGAGFWGRKNRERCEQKHGAGNCEKGFLGIQYPKCRSGYDNFGCCICRPNFPKNTCENAGYADGGRFDISCRVKIKSGDPTPLWCGEDEERDGLLCYPKCADGYEGVGPVCWQICDVDQYGCGAGCARSGNDCRSQITDQVVSTMMLAVTLGSFGLAQKVDDAQVLASNTYKVSGKTYSSMSKSSKAMLKYAVRKERNARVTAIRIARSPFLRAALKGKQRITKAKKGSMLLFSAFANMGHWFAEDFKTATSPEIEAVLDANLSPIDALYIKQVWAAVKFDQISHAESWNLASTVLDFVGLVDPTGVVQVIDAFLSPRCEKAVYFPNIPYEGATYTVELRAESSQEDSSIGVQVTFGGDTFSSSVTVGTSYGSFFSGKIYVPNGADFDSIRVFQDGSSEVEIRLIKVNRGDESVFEHGCFACSSYLESTLDDECGSGMTGGIVIQDLGDSFETSADGSQDCKPMCDYKVKLNAVSNQGDRSSLVDVTFLVGGTAHYVTVVVLPTYGSHFSETITLPCEDGDVWESMRLVPKDETGAEIRAISLERFGEAVFTNHCFRCPHLTSTLLDECGDAASGGIVLRDPADFFLMTRGGEQVCDSSCQYRVELRALSLDDEQPALVGVSFVAGGGQAYSSEVTVSPTYGSHYSDWVALFCSEGDAWESIRLTSLSNTALQIRAMKLRRFDESISEEHCFDCSDLAVAVQVDNFCSADESSALVFENQGATFRLTLLMNTGAGRAPYQHKMSFDFQDLLRRPFGGPPQLILEDKEKREKGIETGRNNEEREKKLNDVSVACMLCCLH